MKKRILSLLLAVVMIMSFIPPVHVHAAECTHSGTYWNVNHGSNTHSGFCYSCWETVSEDCNAAGYTSDYNGHYAACSVCGRKASTTATPHTWAYEVGSYGAGYHKQYCSVCNYTSSSNARCSYSGSYITENGKHWRLCSVCNQPSTKTACSSWNGAESNGDGTHSITCSTCKVAATTDCTYGDYQSNGSSGHRKQCSTCRAYSATEPHASFEYEYDYNGQHKKVCADCGYFLGYENCSFGSYSDLGTQHSRTCSVCKETVKENHSYDYSTKKCVCGAEKHEHSWKLTASGNKITASCTGTTGTCEYNKNGGSLTITASNVDYDGNAKKATVTNTLNTGSYYDDDYTVSYYKKNTSGSYVSIYSAPTDAGEYRATVYSSLDSKVVASVEYKINKVDKTVTASGYTGDYDGNAHGITVNAPEGLKVEYSTNGTSYSSYNVPAYTDAGTYTVYYRVTGNENYNIIDGTGSETVQINKVDKTVTASGYTGDYDGNAHGITVNAPEGLKVEYSTSGSEYSYSTSAPEFTDAGTYTVYYRVTGNKNYNIIDGTGSAVVQINPLEVTVTAEGYVGSYDGEEHGITVNAPADVTVTYDVKEDGWYSYSNSPAYKNAGTYTVYYKATANKNYSINGGENTATGSATVQINQANLEDVVKVTPYSGIYDGKEHSITVEVPDDARVYYSTNGEDWSNWQKPAYENAGTYTVHYKVVSESGNYTTGKARAAEVSVVGSSTVEIDPLDLATVVTAEGAEFTYNRSSSTDGIPHSIKVSVGKTADTVTVEYSTDGGETWVSEYNNPKFTNAGTYPVKYRVYVKDQPYSNTESENYIKTEGEKTVIIRKADLPITELVGYHGPYDGSTHYGFGYKYTTSYGSYFTTYYYNYLHEELNYSLSWNDENGTAKTLEVEAGEEPKLTDFPGFTKQNVVKVDSSKDTDASYGAHKVTVTIGSDNYNDKAFTYYVQIGPGGAIAEDRTFPYDGSEHYIANYIAGRLYYWGFGEVYNFGSIKIEYRVNKEDPTYNGNDAWLPYNQEPGQTNVGSKLVDWKVTMDSDQNGNFGEKRNTFDSPEVFIGTNRVTITAIGLTATANDKTITYGDAPSDNGITITGSFVSPDTEAVVNKSGLDYDHEYAQGMDVGTYDITPKGLEATNYSFTYVSGKLTVEQKPVTILINSSNEISVDENDLVGDDECEIDSITYYKDGAEVTDITAPGTYTAKVTLKNNNYKAENDVRFTVAAPIVPVTNYKVTYDANGGKGEMPEVTVESGSKHTLVSNEFKAPTGKTFKCWKIGDKEYKPGDQITVTKNVTVKAVWKNKTTSDLDYVPASGDNFPVFLWAGLLLFSAVALTEVVVLRRKRR